jgi:hypothetical protein
MERRKILHLQGLELRLVGRPARSQSLYRLSYPPVMDEVLNSEYEWNPCNRSGTWEAHMYTLTYRHVHTETGGIPKITFLYSGCWKHLNPSKLRHRFYAALQYVSLYISRLGVQKTCISLKISTSIFLTIPVLSHVFCICEKVKIRNQNESERKIKRSPLHILSRGIPLRLGESVIGFKVHYTHTHTSVYPTIQRDG